MSLADVVIRLHAFAGAVALGSMWIPMFSRKGGSLHRKAGRVFTGSMACAAATALAASVLRLVERPDAPQGPVLLSLVAIQSAAATWWGVAVLRRKARDGSSRSLPDWLAAAALLVSGFLALAYWLQGAMPLIALFGALNVVFGLRFAHVLGRAPTSRFWWWYEHLFGMLVACIGTLTAFFVVNYRHTPAAFQSAIPGLAVLIAPGLIGGLAIALLTHHSRAKLEGPRT